LSGAAVAAFAAVALLGTPQGIGAAGFPPVPWTGPIPKANCNSGDAVETGLQGHTTLAERESGDSELGYNCNLELVGQYQGEGMWWFGGGNWTSFNDCTYYSTRGSIYQSQLGAIVIDASDPTNPYPARFLDDTATMLNSHEALKVHQKRKLLAAVQNGQYVTDSVAPPAADGFAIYDISGDCRAPQLLANIQIPGTNGHAGNFSPDGMTYYATNPFQFQNDPAYRNRMQAIDVSNPEKPVHLLNWEFVGATGGPTPVQGMSHDVSFNAAGTRIYSPQPGKYSDPGVAQANRPDGLVILDVSDIQMRRPNPQVRVISSLFWEDGGTAQSTMPMMIGGKPFLAFADEAAGPSGAEGGRIASCARGLPPSGFVRLIDISDERNPKVTAKLMLEAHDPANCAEILTVPGSNRQSDYSAHYCAPDRVNDAKMLACSHFGAGLRVFDIRDPYRPREVAYYKPPARRTAFLPGSSIWAPESPDRTVDFTPSDVRWRNYQGEVHLWFSSADNGFQIVRFTKARSELLPDPRGKFQKSLDDESVGD
jgi:hypothetical protein